LDSADALRQALLPRAKNCDEDVASTGAWLQRRAWWKMATPSCTTANTPVAAVDFARRWGGVCRPRQGKHVHVLVDETRPRLQAPG